MESLVPPRIGTSVISLQVLFELRASGSQATRTNAVGKEVDTPQSRFKEQCYNELADLAKIKGNKKMFSNH